MPAWIVREGIGWLRPEIVCRFKTGQFAYAGRVTIS